MIHFEEFTNWKIGRTVLLKLSLNVVVAKNTLILLIILIKISVLNKTKKRYKQAIEMKFAKE